MTIRFLHMGSALSRNLDIWQVIQGKSCRKKPFQSEKCRKSSFFGRVALQRFSSPDRRDLAFSTLWLPKERQKDQYAGRRAIRRTKGYYWLPSAEKDPAAANPSFSTRGVGGPGH